MGTNQMLGGGGFHHVALKTRDWDKSVAFYTATLGFTVRVTWTMKSGKRAGLLDVGDGNYLEIFEDPAATPAPDGALRHIALRATRVDQVIAAVRIAGCAVTFEPAHVRLMATNDHPDLPARIAFFAGPNGEIWELFDNTLT